MSRDGYGFVDVSDSKASYSSTAALKEVHITSTLLTANLLFIVTGCPGSNFLIVALILIVMETFELL